MMNVLSIGNSFSQDAQRYLHSIARADGVELNCFNLYIGGCPISTHYRNMMGNNKAYMLQVNGHPTGFNVTMEEALLNRNWDVITIQQASHESNDYETYQPYLNTLVEYVRECCPKAKIVVHQTWAYEQDSPKLTEKMGYTDCKEMLRDICVAYENAAKDINADFTIPSGELLGCMLDRGIPCVHRDTYHLKYGLGRYAVGLLWYAMLTGNDISANTFCDFDEEVTDKEIAIIKEVVKDIANR